jgi:hypothetical protein
MVPTHARRRPLNAAASRNVVKTALENEAEQGPEK